MKGYGSFRGHKSYFCKRCMLSFRSSTRRDNHAKNCKNKTFTYARYPKDQFMTYNRATKAMSQPYSIFADFEALGENLVQAATNTETKRISKHVPYGAAYCVVSTERSVLEAGYFSGPSCIIKFLYKLKELSDHYVSQINMRRNRIILSKDELADFVSAKKCFYCHKFFSTDDPKVLHHSHLPLWETNGKNYIGACHRNCNLMLKNYSMIPVYFHNLNYDIHFIIQNLKDSPFKKLNV